MTDAQRATYTGPDPDQVALRVITPRRPAILSSGPDEGERNHIPVGGGTVPVWIRGAGPTILLVHGWEGSHHDMRSIADLLVEAGYRTAMFDLPAHGEATGTIAHIPMFAEAILAAATIAGSVEGVIAHSMGAAATIRALALSRFTHRAILIGAPANYEDFARTTAHGAGLDEAGVTAMLERLDSLVSGFRTIDAPSDATRLADVRALLIHADNDRVVPLRDGIRIEEAWPGAAMARLEGLGHRRILAAEQTLDLIRSFLAETQATIAASDQ